MVMRLQWGRVRVNAESPARRPDLPATLGFNGAAFV